MDLLSVNMIIQKPYIVLAAIKIGKLLTILTTNQSKVLLVSCPNSIKTLSHIGIQNKSNVELK